MQISVVQGNRYVVSVLLKIISVVQSQPCIVSVLYNSAVQVKKVNNEHVLNYLYYHYMLQFQPSVKDMHLINFC